MEYVQALQIGGTLGCSCNGERKNLGEGVHFHVDWEALALEDAKLWVQLASLEDLSEDPLVYISLSAPR